MCEQCNVLNINGINCHEHGCPDAWKDQDKECAWCGTEFTPDYRGQTTCSSDCAEDYNA